MNCTLQLRFTYIQLFEIFDSWPCFCPPRFHMAPINPTMQKSYLEPDMPVGPQVYFDHHDRTVNHEIHIKISVIQLQLWLSSEMKTLDIHILYFFFKCYRCSDCDQPFVQIKALLDHQKESHGWVIQILVFKVC